VEKHIKRPGASDTPPGPGKGGSEIPGSRGARETHSGAFARAVTSPVGVLVIFPSLIFLLGSYLTWTGQGSLRQSNLDLAEARMGDQAQLVSEHLSAALGQADLLLSSLESLSLTINSDSEPNLVAPTLRRLLEGHAGASYVSVSFPDGTFEGAFVDHDGQNRFQVSRILGDHTEERVFDYSRAETLTLREVRKSQYDPRTRPFYQLAAASPGRVWTEPYAFARTTDTGITRAVALREGPKVRAVLTFDYDVRRLSPLLMRKGAYVGRPILFDSQGTILADPELKLSAVAPQTGLLNVRTLHDPVLTAFFSQELTQSDFANFETPSGRYLASTAHLKGEGRPEWAVAFLAPESQFLAALETHKQRSLTTAALALLVATLLSAAFARLIVRVRKEATEAREAARQARKEARELGSYRLLEKLGAGGMGEVWRAEHRLLAREAAIKLIKPDEGQGASETARARFQREAQSLASLRSRNTIEVYDYGVTDEGAFFYVMELLDGLDLDSLVMKTGPQPVERVVHIMLQACSSLAEAHEAGLVHRDVKPANIFICRIAEELDIVKVLDFGLVRTVQDGPNEPVGEALALDKTVMAAVVAGPAPGPGADAAPDSNLTRAGNIMGTPAFMAPEQAMGAHVDARADIYALGGVTFWLLTGRTVFSGASFMAQLAAQIVEAPPRLDTVCPQPLPKSLVDLVDACLAKSASDRPQTVRELKRRLELVLTELEPSWRGKVDGWWRDSIGPRSSGVRPVPVDPNRAPTVVLDSSSLTRDAASG
jgi:serine/threonine protein kinase